MLWLKVSYLITGPESYVYLNVQCMFTQNIRKGWQPYDFIVKDVHVHVFQRSLGKGERGGELGLELELFSQATNGRCTCLLFIIIHTEISNVMPFYP